MFGKRFGTCRMGEVDQAAHSADIELDMATLPLVKIPLVSVCIFRPDKLV